MLGSLSSCTSDDTGPDGNGSPDGGGASSAGTGGGSDPGIEVRVIDVSTCDERFEGDPLRDGLAEASEGLFCIRWRTMGDVVRFDAYNMTGVVVEQGPIDWTGAATQADSEYKDVEVILDSSVCFDDSGALGPDPCKIDAAFEIDRAALELDADGNLPIDVRPEYCGQARGSSQLGSLLDLGDSTEGMRCQRMGAGTAASSSLGRLEASCMAEDGGPANTADGTCQPGLECVKYDDSFAPLCWAPCSDDTECGLGGAESCVESHCRLIGNPGNYDG